MMVWTDAAEAGIVERIEAAIADKAKEPHTYIKARGIHGDSQSHAPAMGARCLGFA
jgi:hypothetical protein